MHETRIPIARGGDIPESFGAPRPAVRRSTVAIREPRGIEVFEKSWGRLTATPGVDWVVMQDSGDEYPIKRDVFAQTYDEISPGRYRKNAVSRLVQVPAGVVAVLGSLEGELEVRHPDFIVIGAQDEVYANDPQWVAGNLAFVADATA